VIEIETSETWSVEFLRQDLQGKLTELIENLSEDQGALFSEEDQRIAILKNLEAVHEELKGEHSQDLETGEKLRERKVTVISEIDDRK